MKENRKEQILEELKERVLTLDLAPGTALDEVALSHEYGLSRTPLRELLQRLAGEGFVNLEANRGGSVSSMDFETMRNFFQSAPMIYAAIARLATEQASEDQISQLKKIQTRFRKSVKQNSVQDMVVGNHRFHEYLGVMAASPYLAPSHCRLLIDHTRMSHRFYRVQKQASHQRILDACDQHESMIDAIEQRVPAKTVEVTLKHWELSRSEIDKYVLPNPLPVDDTDIVKELY